MTGYRTSRCSLSCEEDNMQISEIMEKTIARLILRP